MTSVVDQLTPSHPMQLMHKIWEWPGDEARGQGQDDLGLLVFRVVFLSVGYGDFLQIIKKVQTPTFKFVFLLSLCCIACCQEALSMKQEYEFTSDIWITSTKALAQIRYM